MVWRISLAPDAVADLDSIFDFVSETQISLGEPPKDAARIALQRVERIRMAIDRISAAPRRGTLHRLGTRSFRHLTIDRTIFWLTLDEEARVVSVEAIFFGGQDHFTRMLQRLTGAGGTG